MQKRVRFSNRDELQLSGVIHLPIAGKARVFALFAHCFTCTKSLSAAVTIAETLAQRGIATLRFDFTGLGASKGEFSESNFSTNVSDLIDAASFLEAEYQAPELLIGHSLGGTAILAASHKIPSAKAVASIGSPSEPAHILHLLENHLGDIEQSGSAQIRLAGREFKFKQGFVDDVRSHELNHRELRKALMVMHSPQDDTVSIDEASKIFSSAMHPKSFVSLDNADHLLTDKRDSRYVGEVLASWAIRYVDQNQEDLDRITQGVSVTSETHRGFLCEVQTAEHKFIADEPLNFGGTNLGPSPYDFLGAALATCTAMTLNMYARHKKIDLGRVDVKVDHTRVHAEDCVDCEKSAGKVDVFKRVIRLDGNLSLEQRTRMLEIADRCPVHKTLENEIKITTEAGDS